MTFNLAVVGSRHFTDYERLCHVLDSVHTPITSIVSGGAHGADSLSERYADEHNIPMVIFYPEWDKYGKSAGYRRNQLIVARADAMVAFPTRRSIGTWHSIDLARAKGIPVHVVHTGDSALYDKGVSK